MGRLEYCSYPNWLVNGMKYIASLSGGKDSVAMVLKLIEEKWRLDEVVYYDNGMDFNAIKDVIFNQIYPILKDNNIKLIVLHPKNSFMYDMFEREVHERCGGIHYGYSWCGGITRWGTSEKTRVCNSYCKNNPQYIGIAYDEIERCKDKIYPLVEWKMKESDCLNYCKQKGIKWIEHTKNGDVDLYDVLDRVSCWCCSNKNLKELKSIYKYLPEYWEKLKFLQSKTNRPFKKYGNIFELEERFKKEEYNNYE